MIFPIEMYKIYKKEVRIKVPCEQCLANGIVDGACRKCGGNGVHNKTLQVWTVSHHTEKVEKIDRSSEDRYYKGTQTTYVGGLRYWTSYSEFYNEEDRILHFNKNDAQKECDRRNTEIADILKIHDRNKQDGLTAIILGG